MAQTSTTRPSRSRPGWYTPAAVAALVWNLLGCGAYLSDVMRSADAIAQFTPEQQALHAARPAWAVAATATAVWFGAAGSLGLLLRRRWAMPVLTVSLAGVVVQDVWLFLLSDAARQAGSAAFILQGLVLAIAIALLLFAKNADARGWNDAPGARSQ